MNNWIKVGAVLLGAGAGGWGGYQAVENLRPYNDLERLAVNHVRVIQPQDDRFFEDEGGVRRRFSYPVEMHLKNELPQVESIERVTTYTGGGNPVITARSSVSYENGVVYRANNPNFRNNRVEYTTTIKLREPVSSLSVTFPEQEQMEQANLRRLGALYDWPMDGAGLAAFTVMLLVTRKGSKEEG